MSVRRCFVGVGRKTLAFAAMWFLVGCPPAPAEDTPRPLLSIPLRYVEAQVSSDGSHCVVVAREEPTRKGRLEPPHRAEVRQYDLSTGQFVVTHRVLDSIPFSYNRAYHYQSLTPDGRLFCWLDDRRWMVVSRVVDGEEIHRADLAALGVTPGREARNHFWISDDGTFFIGEIRGDTWKRDGARLIRVEFTPSPSVAATIPLSQRSGILGAGSIRMFGDRDTGRIAAVIQGKKGFGVMLTDMNFQKLSQSPLTMPPVCLSPWSGGDHPLVLLSSGPTWMLFSARADRLEMVHSGQGSQLPGGTFFFGLGAVSPDGRHLALARAVLGDSSNERSWLSVWSIGQARPIREVPIDGPATACLRFDTRGKYLTVSGQQNVCVWDFAEMVNATGDSLGGSSR